MSNGSLPVQAPAEAKPGGGPGGRFVPKAYILGFGLLLTATVLLVFYLLLALWPQPTPSTEPTRTETTTSPRTWREMLDVARADSARAADSLRRADSVRTAAAAARPADSVTAARLRDSAAAARRPDSVRALAATSRPTDTTASHAGDTSAAGSGTASGSGKDGPSCKSRLEQAWTRKDKPAPAACVRVFGIEFLLWDEQRLLMLVLLGGALGGLVHVLRSFGWYVGNRELVMSWLPRYVLLITTGSGLAFVFYVVVRGGFFSPGTSFENTSPFGFIAFATLVGLFSEQAILKLKEISETLLSKPAKGSDAAPQGTVPTTPDAAAGVTALTITNVVPGKDPHGAVTHVFTIQGTGFVAQSEVFVNDAKVTSTFVSATELKFELGAIPAEGAVLKVRVRNADGRESTFDHTVPGPSVG
jgi:hypothetical protein